MSDSEKRTPGGDQISERERFRYIGFEVFRGQPKDLFKDEAEKDKYVKELRERRNSDETLRDKCTLLEERVSSGERLVLTLASIVMLAALFLPWYSAYVEVPRKSATPEKAVVATEVDAVQPDSLAEKIGDSIKMTPQNEQILTGATAEDEAAEDDSAAQAASARQATPGAVTHAGERANQEIITGAVRRSSLEKKYSRLSGLGAVGALGTVGADVFSSGFVLVISGLLMLVLVLLCVALPAVNVYALYGIKGGPDERALKLKKLLRLNWLPLIIVALVLILSIFGAGYGFDAASKFVSLGDRYTIATLFDTLSWGVLLVVAASVLVAAKGIEI